MTLDDLERPSMTSCDLLSYFEKDYDQKSPKSVMNIVKN